MALIISIMYKAFLHIENETEMVAENQNCFIDVFFINLKKLFFYG